jgi:hypothetical protein
MKDFINDEEFSLEKDKIEKEISSLKDVVNLDKENEIKAEKLKQSLMFISKAKEKLLNSKNPEDANKVIRYFGYNHLLVDKKFSFEVEDYLKPVLADYKKAEKEYERLELNKTLIKQRKNEDLVLACPAWGHWLNEFRTLDWQEIGLEIDVFEKNFVKV